MLNGLRLMVAWLYPRASGGRIQGVCRCRNSAPGAPNATLYGLIVLGSVGFYAPPPPNPLPDPRAAKLPLAHTIKRV